MPELLADEIDAGFAPARAPAVYAVELDGEAVLLDEAADRLHLMNHTATLLWTLFDGHATIADLAAELSHELGVPYETVVDDILAITRRLGREGLLTGVVPDTEADGQ